MLVFRTISPLNPATTLQQLIDISIEWIEKSPQYGLHELLNTKYGQQEFSVDKDGERFRSFIYTQENASSACICFEKIKDIEKWRTECVYKKTDQEVLASFSVYFETAAFEDKLNDLKKPYIFKLISQRIGFGPDIQFETRSTPHKLAPDALELAERIIKGDFIAHLPCVYVSQERDGSYPVNIRTLCQTLAGMAHVFIEPNVYFARDLCLRTEGLNPYHGAVGIYFPDQTNKKILLPQGRDGQAISIRTIFDAVKNALNFGSIPSDLSYNDIRTNILYKKITEIHNQKDIDLLIESVNTELAEQKEILERKDCEIFRLKEHISRLESRLDDGNDRLLLRGNAADSYNNQVYETLIDILEEARDHTPNGTRRKKIIDALLAANPRTTDREELIQELKNILTGYSSINDSMRSALLRLGFQVKQAGKHQKIFFEDCTELTSILSSSGSDHRGGLNSLSDLKKKLL